jgi:hypothetical protein
MGLSIITLLILWAIAGFPNHEYEWFTLYESGEYRFPILFYLDRVGAVSDENIPAYQQFMALAGNFACRVSVLCIGLNFATEP